MGRQFEHVTPGDLSWGVPSPEELVSWVSWGGSSPEEPLELLSLASWAWPLTQEDEYLLRNRSPSLTLMHSQRWFLGLLRLIRSSLN